MEPTDIQLMLRARDGDVEAFRLLAGRYREPLRRFFAALLPNSSQADDFAQETLLRLWLSRRHYEPTGRFSTYLFQIGRHHWLNERRKARRSPVNAAGQQADIRIVAPPAQQPETVLLEQMRTARIRQAVAALPPHYRMVFEMSHLEGCRYAEIAARLGIPVGTVKSRMNAAVRLLRAALQDGQED